MNKGIFLSGFMMLLFIQLAGQTPCINDLEKVDSVFYFHGERFSGIFECIDTRGVVREGGSIENGLLDSTSFFSKKGDLVHIVWYRNNREDRYRVFSKTASTRLVVNYKGNLLHGCWEEYYLNGQIKDQQVYEFGKPVDIWKSWDKKGRLLTEINFSSEEIIENRYDYKGGNRFLTIRFLDKESNQYVRRPKRAVQKSPQDI